MPDAHANFAYSTLAVAPSPATTGTTATVQTGDGALFPTAPFNAVVCAAGALPRGSNAEIVRVTSIAGDVMTFTRTQEGTSARTVVVGDQFFAAITKKTLTDMEAGGPPPGTFGVHGAATQLGSAAALAKVPLGTVDYDPSGYFSTANSRFQPTIAGYYQVTAGVRPTVAIADGDEITLAFQKNGAGGWLPGTAGLVEVGTGSTYSAANPSPQTASLVYLNGTTDYLELWGLCITNAGVQVTGTFTAWMNGFMATVAPSPPGAGGQGIFAAHGATTQLGSGGAMAKVPLGTIDYDLSGYFSTANSRFQPTVAGYYQISAGIASWSVALADGDVVQIALYKNGSAIANDQGASGQTGGAVFGLQPAVAKLVYLNGSTDYVELFGVCLTGAVAQVTATCIGWMSGFLAAPAPVPTVTPTYSDLQNGVVKSTDCAISGVSVSAAGLVTFTLAAANPLWVTMPSGVLVPITFPGGTFAINPVVKPASGYFCGFGVDIGSDGTVSLFKCPENNNGLAQAQIDSQSLVAAAGKVRVADIYMGGGGSYTYSGTRDRRPWARGAYGRITRTQNAGGTSDYTTSSASFVAIDSTNLQQRIECTGGPVRAQLSGVASVTTSGGTADFAIYMDGALIDGGDALLLAPTVNPWVTIEDVVHLAPAAGSHLFVAAWKTSATATLAARSGSYAVVFAVEELLRANANNGTS